MAKRPIDPPEAELMVQTLVMLMRDWMVEFTRIGNESCDRNERYTGGKQ